VVFAKSREELVAATKALDRMLLWNTYIVPQWTYDKVRARRWDRFANAAAKLKARSFTLDGEAVVCGADGVAVFDALHRRGRIREAILQAFDLLELDGVDYRPLPLSRRKDRLARLLARVPVGIALNEHTDARGELVFRQACAMGLEGIVSKRLGERCRGTSGLSSKSGDTVIP
jgi:ATP-dependent DNA ligase